ncbi:conserved hypothetical protein [Candidatus Sulfopaludibacter sp. SbA4]|nr:conserved hypothetical protein [Candidatus Sulfopaludibacter sp. SbA4]
MYQDYKDLLSAFHAHGVKYLVVGGFAVIYHAQPRFTKDMDLFIKADLENAKATYAALAEFGAPLQGIRPEDFTDRNNFFRFGRDPKGFDILPAIPGVDFDAAWERRVETVVDTTTGLKANFISADDLIASKLASGRARDLADVEDIRKAAESQQPRPAQKKPPEPTLGGAPRQ